MSKKLYLYIMNPVANDNGSLGIFQDYVFKNKIQNTLFDSSTYVLNITDKKIEKTRLDGDQTFEQLFMYAASKHQKVKEVYDYMNQPENIPVKVNPNK